MRDLLPTDRPILALAPMQAVTDLPFMRVMKHFGGPDYFVTEYFRIYENCPLDKYILRSITENQTNKPIFAQMIGSNPEWLADNGRKLMRYDIAGIDINLGCPAPVVCRKDAGGGLLRKPQLIHQILDSLRTATPAHMKFTVKTRVGYESEEEFEQLLSIFNQYDIDALAIHGRTVKERYQTPVHTNPIKQAVETLNCPVIANGNVVNAITGENYIKTTGAAGLMIGRGAIRNPWIFSHLRQLYTGGKPTPVTKAMLLEYISLLYEELAKEAKLYEEEKHVNKMKKYLVYISQGIGAEFEHQIRRVKTANDFHATCKSHLSTQEIISDLPPENSKLFCGFSSLLSTV